MLVILLHEFQQCFQLVVHFLKAHRKRDCNLFWFFWCAIISQVRNQSESTWDTQARRFVQSPRCSSAAQGSSAGGVERPGLWRGFCKGKISGTLANLKDDCRDLHSLSSILCDHQSEIPVRGLVWGMFVSTFTLQKETPYAGVQWKPKGSPAPSAAVGDLQGGGHFGSFHSVTLWNICSQEASKVTTTAQGFWEFQLCPQWPRQMKTHIYNCSQVAFVLLIAKFSVYQYCHFGGIGDPTKIPPILSGKIASPSPSSGIITLRFTTQF